MEFHEDVIFKSEGQEYGPELLEIINIKGKLIEVHQTEYAIIDPKIYKPDMVFELKDKIIMLEFQSTRIKTKDKKRFRLYSALFDHLKNKTNKDIEVHVLSTVEKEKIKYYNINPEAKFPIYIHSLETYDGDEFLNTMNNKIANNMPLTKKELLMISLICFMKSKSSVEQCILNSAVTITNIPDLYGEMGQFIKGVLLILCDKFVKNKSLNKTITNLVGGNMKCVEDYAQRKVDENNKRAILTMYEDGVEKEIIANYLSVSLDFVEDILHI